MSKRQSGGKEPSSTHIKRPCVQVPRPVHVYAHEPVHGCSLHQNEVDRTESSAPHICSSSIVDIRQRSPDQPTGSHSMDKPPQTSPLRNSPLQHSPPQMSPVRVSPPLVSPSHVSPPRVSPPHVSPTRVSPTHVSPTHVSPTCVSPPHSSPSRSSPSHSSPPHTTNCETYHHHYHHHHHHPPNHTISYSPNTPNCDSHQEPVVPKVVPKSSGAVLPMRSNASLPTWIKSEDSRPAWAKRPQAVKDVQSTESKARGGEKHHQEPARSKPELETASPVTRWPNAPKWVELEQLCKAITSGHDRACKLLNQKSSSLQAALSSMKGTPDFQLTKEEILSRLSVLLGSQYERIVQFAQSIPGFAEFSKEDQRILLQIGGLEVILLQLSQVYDHKSKLLRMWEGMWLSPEQARKLTSDFNLAVFFELLFSLAESLNGMHLREEDIAVFSALLLLASDLQGLKQKMQVEALQDKVLSGFAYMLSQNHRCKPNLLPQVLMCMPTLRTISTSYLELTTMPRHLPPPPDSTAMSMRLF